MKNFTKWFLITVGIICLIPHVVNGQDTQQLIGQVAQIYTESDFSSSGLIGGFSLWGLIAGILFGSIGFIAFIYGKKNTEFRPMLIGIALMGYPYFLRGTIALFVVGIGLTATLYYFR